MKARVFSDDIDTKRIAILIHDRNDKHNKYKWLSKDGGLTWKRVSKWYRFRNTKRK